jgi:hypothetical protein
VQPNTKGLKAVVYRGDRNYADMKGWMLEILPPLSSKTTEGGVSSEVSEQLEELTRLFVA